MIIRNKIHVEVPLQSFQEPITVKLILFVNLTEQEDTHPPDLRIPYPQLIS